MAATCPLKIFLYICKSNLLAYPKSTVASTASINSAN